MTLRLPRRTLGSLRSGPSLGGLSCYASPNRTVLPLGLKWRDPLNSGRPSGPGRPEEFHLQPPTDPDVRLSAHPARANHGVTAFPHSPASEAHRLIPCGWPAASSSSPVPFAPCALHALHHYYGTVRPLPAHRYFPPSRITLIGFSLSIADRVLTFYARARTKLMPTLRRMPRRP